ncbi:BCCT family transporter [Robiginitomaculum antarcticum]|uniref:BCCT family transporter n=1 Tax=Robiginitomaculum antarcticum TaxID=437507 RepID=UPI0012EA92D1|nr:BCCT family transporter [Robiginitomaculum antarcticum]
MKFSNIRPIVFWLPISVFIALVVTSLVNTGVFLSVTSSINDWILAVFAHAFSFGAFAFVLTCCWAMVSPIGKIRIGGAASTPLLSRWNWFAITLTTTVAVGILFWATAEPIYHLYNPGGLSIVAGSDEAVGFSMTTLFMHWAFTPYAIYTIPGLTFALVYYNLKKPFSLSSPISALTGRTVPQVGADILDGFALLSLLFGLTAVLGVGMMSISGGIDRLTSLSSSPLLLACVALAIVSAFFLSSVSGLHRGIRILSDINTKIFIALMIFVLFAGSTWGILELGFRSIGQYAAEFIPRSLFLDPFNNREWLNSWTVFYWANWLAWAPLTAMFLGKISRGYTVREYVFVNFFAPALFSILWMTIFGGTSLNVESNNPGFLKDVLDTDGPDQVLFAVIDFLPLAIPVAILFIIVSFISYVTAADSNMEVMAALCVKDKTPDPAAGSRIGIKFIWASLVGIAAWVMTSLSGIDGVKMMSNLGGLPALFIVILFNITLIMLGTVKIKDLRGV